MVTPARLPSADMSEPRPVNLSTSGPPETVLDAEPEAARRALAEALASPQEQRRAAVAAVVARWPRFLDAWAQLGALGRDEIERYAENLLILREDLRDPVLRARGAAWERELVAALDARCGPGTGHLLAAHWQGAVTWWAFRPDDRLPEHLRESLGALVARLHPGE